MIQEFDIVVDNQGYLHVPREVRERHGLWNGARIRAEDRPNAIVFKAPEDELSIAARQKAAIRSIVGIVSGDSKIMEHYLEEKRNERLAVRRSAEESGQ